MFSPNFVCFLQARLARGMTLSASPFIRLLPNLSRYFEKRINRFWCKLARVVHRFTRQGNETINSGGSEVKGQGHMRPKVTRGIILNHVLCSLSSLHQWMKYTHYASSFQSSKMLSCKAHFISTLELCILGYINSSQ